jgi:hypothetical protein
MQNACPALVVSIHDVSPLTRATVSAMLGDLAAAGVSRTSLLVIPNHHHKAPVADDPGFGAWLRAQSGHEMVLHGYYHQRPPGARGWKNRLITEQYTAGEGEFFDLTEDEAYSRVENGRRELRTLGADPVGFIAPAWLLGAAAEHGVRRAGFRYTTRLKTVKDLTTGRETVSQSLVWSVRAAWRRVVSLGWNAFLFRRLTANRLVRVGLHPPDWQHPAIRRQTLQLIRRATAGRRVATYAEWMEADR